MKCDIIFQWLDLPAAPWPPNHYSLLGLPRGETDVALIEERVHQRIDLVRRYQLSHSEQATEAMNRLAQALVCLTDAASKRAYDASLGIEAPALPTAAQPALVSAGKQPSPPDPARHHSADEAAHRARTIIDWDTATEPPPSRAVAAPEPPRPPANGQAGTTQRAPILVSAPADPVFETARTSPEAKRGLGTKRALYNRLAHTRQLCRAWDAAGKFLGQPKRRPVRPSEDVELVNQLTAIRDLLADFPAFVGEAGQPGQHVAAIAYQQMMLQTFKMLDLNQREALAKDWLAGRTLLASHRSFLRQELQALRQRTWWGRMVRAVRAALNDHPGYVIVGIGVAALLVALVHWITGP
jgi:hypothetical protein